jgi:hypothetical protein
MDIKQDELAVMISLLMLHSNPMEKLNYKDIIDKAFLAANYITKKLEE